MQAAVAGNVHPTTPAIMTATTPATMPVKQVEAMKHGGRDSGELTTADRETGSRGGSDDGEQSTSRSTRQRQTIERRGSRELKVKRRVETVIDAADRGSGTVWATGDGRRATGNGAHADLQHSILHSTGAPTWSRSTGALRMARCEVYVLVTQARG